MKNKICLVMICYNNEAIIRRALDSAAPYIHYFLIVDDYRGSTDGTINEINAFKEDTGIPGEVICYNRAIDSQKRTFALEYANSFRSKFFDYFLLLDTDNTLEIETPLDKVLMHCHNLNADAYYITKKTGQITYPFLSLLSARHDWKYTGILHEYPERADGQPFTQAHLPGVFIIEPEKDLGEGSGQRSRAHYYDHALQLERELFFNLELPELQRQRYMFYIAQSWNDAGMTTRALDSYIARAKMGGWDEEIFYCLLQIALIKKDLESAIAAYDYRPHRLEAAYLLMEKLIELKCPGMAWHIGRHAGQRTCTDTLFIQQDIYQEHFPKLMSELERELFPEKFEVIK